MDRILIEQNLGRGWVELIVMDIEENATKEEIIEAGTTLVKELAKNEVTHITKKDGFGVVITRADGPIRVELLPKE